MFHAVGTDLDLSTTVMYGLPIATGHATSFEDRESNQPRKVLPLNHQVSELEIEGDFSYQFNGELSYGPDPCSARVLRVSQGVDVNFIANYFR